jgi:hypothetical protein
MTSRWQQVVLLGVLVLGLVAPACGVELGAAEPAVQVAGDAQEAGAEAGVEGGAELEERGLAGLAAPDGVVRWIAGGAAVLLLSIVTLLGADAWRRNDVQRRR